LGGLLRGGKVKTPGWDGPSDGRRGGVEIRTEKEPYLWSPSIRENCKRNQASGGIEGGKRKEGT